MKIIFVSILIIIFLYVAFIAVLYFFQNRLVYLPPKLSEADLQPLAAYKNLEVKTADGLTLKGYYLAPDAGRPLIVMFHGNASHPAWKVAKFKDWMEKGYGFLLAEYRGYGGNPGLPTEDGLYKDGQAYLDWVKAQPDLKSHPLVIYGESLGSGVAVDVAAHNPVAALILEVTFSRLSDVGAWHYPYIPFAQMIMKNKYPNENKIKNVHAPVLFLLAGQDEVVPVQFGKKLAEAANQPKEIHIFPEARHNEVYNFGAGQVVREFLERHFPESKS